MKLIDKVVAHLKGVHEQRRLRYRNFLSQAYIETFADRDYIELFTVEELARRRKSDTIFILGSGPSLNALTPEQWKHISEHDSFGINYSFLKNFPTTYHLMEDPKTDECRRFFIERLSSRRKILSSSIWFTSDRHVDRLIHPLYAREMFPDPARTCVFEQPARVGIQGDRPFQASDFEPGLVFRGTLSVVLDVIVQLGYPRLVLLGIDLHTPEHFFDILPEMKPYVDYQIRVGRLPVFESMIPKAGQFRKQDEYLVALHELHLTPKGRSLHMGFQDPVIHPRLPLYSWPA